jgi:cytochrome P450
MMEVIGETVSRLYDFRYVLLSSAGLYLFFRLFQWIYKAYCVHQRYHDIISLPRHPIYGNLVNAGSKLNPSLGRHPDYGFEEIWHELGEPGCFLIDLAPVDRGFLIMAEPSSVEALVNPSEQFKYSVPKSDTYNSLTPLIGSESMITKEGEDWKQMRKRFNPGFQPKYIHSLAGSVVSKTEIFVERLKQAAETNVPFKLGDYAKDLTTDIITQLTIAKDLKAQSTPEGQGEKSLTGLLTASRRLSELVYAVGQGIGYHMIDPIRPLKAFYYEQIFDRKLTSIVAAQMAEMQTNKDQPAKSITQLAVSGMPPSAKLIRSCVHQIKSFLFAGQDTTATLIQWLCYELSKAAHSPHHATILARMRAEHDSVFGSDDPFSAISTLSATDSTSSAESLLATKLPYTTAFIKETLRLHPPAGTARMIPPATTSSPGLSIPINGKPTAIDGLRIYPVQYLIHRNPAIWGPTALLFQPERWLDESYMATIPPGSWRPFERGPRNCIGQELAMLEGRVVLACVARGLEFEKVGLTGRVGVDGKVEREVWSTHAVTSVPVDGMVMRVKLTDKVGGD